MIQQYQETTDERIKDWLIIFKMDIGDFENLLEQAKPKILYDDPMPERFADKLWLEFICFGFSDHANKTGDYDQFNQLFDFVSEEFSLDQLKGGMAKRLLKTRFDFLVSTKDYKQAIEVGEHAIRHNANIKTQLEKVKKKLEDA